MLKYIQHRLDGMKAGVPRSTQAIDRREQQQKQPKHHNVYKDYTDNDEKDQGLYMHVRKRANKARKSRYIQQGKLLPHVTLGRCELKLTKP